MKGDQELCRRIRDLTRPWRLLVHTMMLYRCKDCGYIEQVYCGYGVEGPPALRTSGTYIASPFSMSCRHCRGDSTHYDFGADQHFATLRELPLGARAFVVPDGGPDPEMFNSSCFSGEMHTRTK